MGSPRRRQAAAAAVFRPRCSWWFLVGKAGGGSLVCSLPVLDGNLGRRWWGLLPSGSLLSFLRSRCRSNWTEWEKILKDIPGRTSHAVTGLVDALVFILRCTFSSRWLDGFDVSHVCLWNCARDWLVVKEVSEGMLLKWRRKEINTNAFQFYTRGLESPV